MQVGFTDDEAEAIIYAMALRAKQCEQLRQPSLVEEARRIAEKVEQAGIEQNRWTHYVTPRFIDTLSKIKRIAITY